MGEEGEESEGQIEREARDANYMDVIWHNHYGNQHGNSRKELNLEILLDSAIPLP